MRRVSVAVRLSGLLLALPLLPALAHAQTNKPIPAFRFVNDGKPYNIIPLKGDKWAKQRACPYWYGVNDGTETRLSLNATAICHRKVDKTRVLMLNFTQIPRGGAPRRETVAIDFADSALVFKRFTEVLRTGLTWREGKEPIEPKTLSYNPVPHLSVEIRKVDGLIGNYPITVRFLSTSRASGEADAVDPRAIDVTFGTLEDYAAFVSTFEKYRTWLEGQ